MTQHRTRTLGIVTGHGIRLSHAGRIVTDILLRIPERFPGCELDAFVVMPDHVHAIILLHGLLHGAPQPGETSAGETSVSDIVGWVKSRSARRINATRCTRGHKVWQTSFHDRIVRTSSALPAIRRYIAANPATAWRKQNMWRRIRDS